MPSFIVRTFKSYPEVCTKRDIITRVGTGGFVLWLRDITQVIPLHFLSVFFHLRSQVVSVSDWYVVDLWSIPVSKWFIFFFELKNFRN